MSANEKNTGMLLDKIQSLPEDVQMKIGYMIEGAALVASSRPQPTDQKKSAGKSPGGEPGEREKL